MTNTTLRTVRLSGELGAKFGRVYKLAVCSVAEAVAALCAVVPGFEAELLGAEGRGVRYACFVAGRNVGEAQLEDIADGDIHIAPVLSGSKNGGLFQVVLGAALVVGAGLAIPGSGAFAALGAGGFSGAVAGVGMAMFFGGIVQLISPQQRAVSARDNPENGASYNFNGAVNTTAQGNCYPVLYGELFVGSQVLSAGIYAEDQA